MKKLILSLFLVAIAATNIFASNTQVNGIWYDFNSSTKTASVTYQGSSSSSYNKEYSGSVVIPETVTYNGILYSVTTINNGAFYCCSGLTSVTIHNSVTTIGDYAFYNCSGLTSVTIPNSVTTIGRSAFKFCSGLTSVTIGNSVTTIGEEAFEYCSNIKSVTWNAKNCNGWGVFGNQVETFVFGDEVEVIPSYICRGMNKLTTIAIPISVRTIRDHAFSDCTGLESITVEKGNSMFDSRDNCNAIIQTASSTLIVGCKTTIIPNSVTTIGENAFYDCSGLTSITIPNSVTTIGEKAFSGCSSLTSITIPNSVTTIGNAAFFHCFCLTSVTIGNSVTTIGEIAFQSCSTLTSITIPNSVTMIESGAFYGCSSLTSVTIGNSVTTIGNNAFQNCNKLKIVFNDSQLYISKKSENHGYVAYYADKVYDGIAIGDFIIKTGKILTEYIGKESHIVIPNYVTTIRENVFSNYIELRSIEIPNSVTTIGEKAFFGCTGLTSINIPSSVTTIENSVFSGCTGLSSVILPSSITAINEQAFYNCIGLDTISLPNSVTAIGKSAFYGCSGLTSITIPISIKKIWNKAFDGCTNMKKVIWNAKNCYSYSFGNQIESFIFGSEVEIIPVNLCKGMSKLTSINIPNSVTTINNEAFYGCSGLTSVTIPNSVTTIGDEAFLGCSGLTAIAIPNSVTTIGKLAFSSCSGLTSVTIPNSVTTIESSVFSDCSKLTSISIPNSVTRIGESAFENCSYLKTITLGKALTEIGCNAFKGDYRIEEITSYAEVTPNVCSTTFDGLSKQYIYLYVPENSIRGYQVDPNWNGFDIRTKSAEKKPMDDDNPVVTPTDQDVTITWPITDGTDTYILTITKNGEVVCVLTFNAQGQLTNIAFAAPGHNGAHQAPAATLSSNGYTFRVTGLDRASKYGLSLDVKDKEEHVIKTYTSAFATTGYVLQKYTITVNANDDVMGKVTGSGTYDELSTTPITAIPNEHYHFVQWNDGNTTNPRQIFVEEDKTYTAIFSIDQHIISATAEHGVVVGAGTYDYGTEITLTATPNEHYHFVQWSDGVTTASRKIIVEDDATYTALFAIDQFTISVVAENGSVSGAGTYDYGTEVTLTATPNEGYEFVDWSNGITDNPYTFIVEQDVELTANFKKVDTGWQDVYSGINATKYFHNGNLIIERNGIKYTPAGQKVR